MSATSANPVQAENALAGAPRWNLLRPTNEIEGYAAEASVSPGETLAFHVAGGPGAVRYRIDVYRLGWYAGAGARLVGCLPACWADRWVTPRPPAPAPDSVTGELAAGWPATDELAVPDDWISGYYEARVVVTAGDHAGRAHPVYFVVRAARRRESAALVQVPVNTWQAYNNWGGRSLYNFNSLGGARANHVSFDRPFELPPAAGAQATPLAWEIQLVRFLEREGIDVSYQTDVDTDHEPESLLRHRLVVTAGHGEYWTKAMRDGFDSARDQGTNLAFMGANNAYWQVRYERGGRTLVGYKSWADPIADRTLATVLFRELGRPECALVGVMHLDSMGLTDYAVNPAALADAWFAGTGFTSTSALPAIVGLEYDAIPLAPPSGCAHRDMTVFFRHEGPPGNAEAVRYVADSGARVFASGTMQFSWALDDFGLADHPHRPPDERVRAFMRNALTDLLRPARPRSVSATAAGGGVRIAAETHSDPRVSEVVIIRHDGRGPFDPGTGALVCRTQACADARVPGHRWYRYAAFVRDRWGASEAALSDPVEVPNTRPALRLVGPGRALAARLTTFRAVALDADGDACTLRWRLDGRVRRGGALLAVRLRAGRHRVSVTADDGHGAVASAARLVVVPRR